MLVNHFFRFSWLVQLLVGIGLFCVSFILQAHVLHAFLASFYIAMTLAAVFELGKAAAIVWHRYLHHQISASYTGLTRVVSSAFRVGLVVLSLMCSLLFLSVNLDRPHVDAVRSSELIAVKLSEHEQLKTLDKTHQAMLADLRASQQHDARTLTQYHERRIQPLESALAAEMNNVINGEFKGKRYLELERRLKEARQIASTDTLQLVERQRKDRIDQEAQINRKFVTQREKIIQDAINKKQDIRNNDYANDERVNDKRIVALLKLSESVFDKVFEPLQFVFLFAVLVSLLIEAGIVLAFETVTVAMLPAIAAQHESDVETEVLKTRVNGEQQRDNIRHVSAIDRVAKRAGKTIKDAETLVSQLRNKKDGDG